MKILFDNVSLESTSGPNGFARKLQSQLEKENEISLVASETFIPDIQLSFIASHYQFAPIVQRLDGIYFNTDQDWRTLNSPIKHTYEVAESVIFQSEFNKKLTTKFFGEHKNSHIIRNGTDLNLISNIKPMENEILDNFENVWVCASSWRPHKRLSENIRYFIEKSAKHDCLVICGENPDVKISDPRIFYAGHLRWIDLISLYRRATHFIHLSFLDHCPNVVVDARAAGCHIVCSSTGGTKEIAGKNSTVIVEDEWDFTPMKLYNPPAMDFSNTVAGDQDESIDISEIGKMYLEVLENTLS